MAVSALYRDLLCRKSFWSPSVVQELRFLREPAALLALERNGIDLQEPQPEQLLARYASPLLVVGGTDDVTVPLALTQNLFRAAREPKTLYLVFGGSHGNFVQTAGDEYLERLIGHFTKALAAP